MAGKFRKMLILFGAITSRNDWIVVCLYLLLLEVVCFFPGIANLGFYLDDWYLIQKLHFSSTELISRVWLLLHEPKVVIRPVEAIHFSVLYNCFGDEPLGYHITNACAEVIAAVLFYSLVRRISKVKSVAFVCAIVLLLYPIHFVTHYWVVAGSITLSLVLYLVSANLQVLAAEAQLSRHSLFLKLLACITFFLSVFNYESFIAFFVFNVFIYFLQVRSSPTISKILIEGLPYLLVVLSSFVYTYLFLDVYGLGWVHKLELDPAQVAKVLASGCQTVLGIEPFYYGIVNFAKESGGPQGLFHLLLVCPLGAVIFFGLAADLTFFRFRPILLFGMVGVVTSYLIFSLNSEYIPESSSLMNRVNYGAVLGIGLIIASCANGIAAINRNWASFLVFSLLLIMLFSNNAVEKPWIVSWQWQKYVIRLMSTNKSRLIRADSVFLMACPRYIKWAPVFDGTWDFENMARILMDSPNLKAGVVTPRLVMESGFLVDRSKGVVCQTYAPTGIKAIVAETAEIQNVDTLEGFISLVREKGLKYGIDSRICETLSQSTK